MLVTSAATPCVSFVWEKDLTKSLAGYTKAAAARAKNAVTSPSTIGDHADGEPEVPPAAFAIPLAEIRGLRKVGMGGRGR